jgi:hypothetical protein
VQKNTTKSSRIDPVSCHRSRVETDVNSISYSPFSEEDSGFSKSAFSRLLRECLISRYGKLPSASFVAREFNIRAYGCEPITQESARRWLRGLSIPTGSRIGVIQAWLKFDLNQMFNRASRVQEAPLLTTTPDISIGQSRACDDPLQSHQNQEDEFFKIWKNLSPSQKSALVVIAHQLHEATHNSPIAPTGQFVQGHSSLGSSTKPIDPSNSKKRFQ